MAPSTRKKAKRHDRGPPLPPKHSPVRHSTISLNIPQDNFTSRARLLSRPNERFHDTTEPLACHLPTLWPVQLPTNDISNFDFHLTPKLIKIRNCSSRKIRYDKVTHGSFQLQNLENMLNAQDLYDHIRRYCNNCFLHAAYKLMLNILYPVLQHKMINWRNLSFMSYLLVTLAATNRPRKRSSTAIDIDTVTKWRLSLE